MKALDGRDNRNVPILLYDVVLPASARFTACGKAKSNSPWASSPDVMAMEQYKRINKHSLHNFYDSTLVSDFRDEAGRQPLIVLAAQVDIE
jgi:hypothetical protein